MLYLRSFGLSTVFLSAFIPLAAPQTSTPIKDPWDDIQYRLPVAPRGPLAHPSIRDFVIRQNVVASPGQPVSRPPSGIVSVNRLKHRVPAKARRELARSEQQYRKGHLQASIEHLKKAIEIDPAYMEAHNNLGARYIALGDNERAVPHLQTALQLDPTSDFAQLNLSLALYFLKRCDQAEQSARAAVRLTPQLPKAHYLLGLILEAEGKDTPDAVEHLEKSAVEFPTAHLLAARTLLRRGAVADATVELRRYLAWPQAENRPQVEQWLAGIEP